MRRITPNIWCTGTADEAAAFYGYVFESAPGGTGIHAVERYPEEGLLDFQEPFAGKTLTVTMSIGGLTIILINAGNEFRPSPALNFMLNFDPAMDPYAHELQQIIWDRLKEDGRVLMDLEKYPFSRSYGWVEDRYGVSWQLILTDPSGEPRPFVIPSLMFGGADQNKAVAAQRRWVDVFPDSRLGMRAECPEQTGPATAGALMFSEFQLAGQWFTAMDSAVDQQASFTPGVSLMFEAHGQDELDRVWGALSAVPEAEQCGWLVDQFGVSWQIVPDNMDELLARPGAFEKFLGMKKIQISDFG